MKKKSVLIFGVTGNIGGATTSVLMKRGWHVRGVTRNPKSDKAQALKKQGVEVIQGDMDDQHSLKRVFNGVERVLSVQNWVTNGIEGEIRQGKLVAEVAHSAGIEHLVYASAGTGDRNTELPHFDTKIIVEDYMRSLELPFTIVRPVPFMELLTEKEFFPAMVAWGMKPRIVGWDKPIPWVAVHDIGLAIANIFDDPDKWIGADIAMCGDIKTLAESQSIFSKIVGKKPLRIPLPIWLFRKMARDEFIEMWEWMDKWINREDISNLMNLKQQSRAVCPDPIDMESWLLKKRNGGFN